MPFWGVALIWLVKNALPDALYVTACMMPAVCSFQIQGLHEQWQLWTRTERYWGHTCAEGPGSALHEYCANALVRAEGYQGIVLGLHHVCRRKNTFISKCSPHAKRLMSKRGNKKYTVLVHAGTHQLT